MKSFIVSMMTMIIVIATMICPVHVFAEATSVALDINQDGVVDMADFNLCKAAVLNGDDSTVNLVRIKKAVLSNTAEDTDISTALSARDYSKLAVTDSHTENIINWFSNEKYTKSIEDNNSVSVRFESSDAIIIMVFSDGYSSNIPAQDQIIASYTDVYGISNVIWSDGIAYYISRLQFDKAYSRVLISKLPVSDENENRIRNWLCNVEVQRTVSVSKNDITIKFESTTDIHDFVFDKENEIMSDESQLVIRFYDSRRNCYFVIWQDGTGYYISVD